MARPKRANNEPSVKDRIEDAFWILLETTDYSNIGIKMLATEAGVNHNSIYYHYENLDDIAKSAFQNTIIHELRLVIGESNTATFEQLHSFLTSQPEVQKRYMRIKLFAAADSIYLQNLLKDGLIDNWLSQSDKSRSDLSAYELMELDFMFSGIISLMRNENSPENLEQFIQDNLGQALVKTIRNILYGSND